jgi:aminoglycoside phosphotransferase
MPGKPQDVAPLLQRIAQVASDLEGAPYEVLGEGWDSVALDVAGEWIFKFPRSADAEASLLREAGFLDAIAGRVRMNVPQLIVHDRGDRPFSQHRKIAGEHLLAEGYRKLTEEHRDRLARQLAELYVDLHAIPIGVMVEAGAEPVDAFPSPEWIEERLGRLPAHLQAYGRDVIARWREEIARPADLVFGQFDGHGWNMAFDHASGTLNGVFDFADAGIGERHRDFALPNLIDPDLTGRVIAHYADLTGIAIDPARVDLNTAVQRFWEHLTDDEIDQSWLDAWAEYEAGRR